MNTKKKTTAVKQLEKVLGESLSFGLRLNSLRQSEGQTLEIFAKRLSISKQHLNDIEKGRKSVSPERAARFAKILGFAEDRFIQLALQDQLTQAGFKYKVQVS
ncbi:helix-turn-helix domain-containing protein [Bdellovibrio svalbardensis]|uniref:Helix-turn-helix domain-containing protein n=1 Tax=Bdellovibrio svalbardensis TaxID=2972972 RepID=A0ABT6DND5_9BACT|nr:helix-turn-helix transcriptional regulator [Bdellovibrio svalbardensis]MDG0817336.1 helix-turn-helix domain-containing protein [Bdellovibrio svalbardensis]